MGALWNKHGASSINVLVVIWVLSMAGPHHEMLQLVGACMTEAKCVEAKDEKQHGSTLLVRFETTTAVQLIANFQGMGR
jgi:hypothetical protein